MATPLGDIFMGINSEELLGIKLTTILIQHGCQKRTDGCSIELHHASCNSKINILDKHKEYHNQQAKTSTQLYSTVDFTGHHIHLDKILDDQAGKGDVDKTVAL